MSGEKLRHDVTDDTGVRFGLVLPNWEAGSDVQRLVEAAVAAEEAGWDGVFLADHLIFPPPDEVGTASTRSDDRPMADPWITLAGIATKTHGIRLGTWVTPIPRRQPWQVARDTATLDRLSGGRVILGAGLGRRPDYELFAQSWDLPSLASRCDEALSIIDRLWTGKSVTLQGDHYSLNDAVILPTPVQDPRIPVIIGGLWPSRAAVRRGARWDGIMTHFPGDGVLAADRTLPETHASDMVRFYRSIAHRPGEVFLPAHPEHRSPDYPELVRELGASWLYVAKVNGEWTLDVDKISEGPYSLADWPVR